MPRMPKKPDCCPPCPHPTPRQESSTDVKLKILESKFVPKDLIHNFEDLEITDTTYVYIDQNGTPGKICALDIISKDISWDQLSEEVQNKILIGVAKQDKLVAGDHIVISDNNEISVSLEAKDIGAITESDAKTIIADNVVLEVASIKPELKQEILGDVDNRLAQFKTDIDQQIHDQGQEIIAITDERIAARLKDVDKIVEEKVASALSNAWIDAGLVTED